MKTKSSESASPRLTNRELENLRSYRKRGRWERKRKEKKYMMERIEETR